jgi:hypothetical protein
MEDESRPDFSFVVHDNEAAVAQALAAGDFVKAYLLVHALVEALLRLFLRTPQGSDLSFAGLIKAYRVHLDDENYPNPEFVDELTKFNKRRNPMIHELWKKGYSFTNRHAEPAAAAALVLYGLLIEWLETFDDEITDIGFRYDGSV